MIDFGFETYFAGPIKICGVKTMIGKYCSIGDGLEVIAGEHPIRKVSSFPFHERYNLDYEPTTGKENVIIGNDVWIGYNVTIKHGITIGDGATIGMKTVITKNVSPYEIVVGNPMILKGYRFAHDIIEKLLVIKWWNWDLNLIKENIKDFMDVEKFVKKYYIG
jgi:lipopolysaccharide transport system ATP-binding protein